MVEMGEHVVLLVAPPDGSGTWLVDVGFGLNGFLEPLAFDTLKPVQEYEQSWGGKKTVRYRLQRSEETSLYTYAVKLPGEDWADTYRFGLKPFDVVDYQPMCNFHMDAGGPSPFVKGRVITLPTAEGGRKTLAGCRVILTSPDGGRQDEAVAMGTDGREYMAKAAELFHLAIPAEWACLYAEQDAGCHGGHAGSWGG